MNPVRTLSTVLLSGVGVVLLGTLAACGSEDDASATTAVHEVRAGEDSCEVDDTTLDAGRHAFRIENVGSDVTEVYVYGKDGEEFSKIMGERENIGPGTSQTLEVDLAAGHYQVACKPGMTGDGIRTDVEVTGSGGSAEAAEESYDRELEFTVSGNRMVHKPTRLRATAGERIEFKLENDAAAEYYLEVLSPSGEERGEAEAEAGEEAEFVAELSEPGDYAIKVFPDDHEEDATTVTLTVSQEG